jgi:hypothetical protein
VPAAGTVPLEPILRSFSDLEVEVTRPAAKRRRFPLDRGMVLTRTSKYEEIERIFLTYWRARQ